jgi:hypothetical protein
MHENMQQFDENNLKIDKDNNVYLVNEVKGIKEIMLLNSQRGHGFIRKIAKSLGIKLSKKVVDEICDELEATAFDIDGEKIQHHKRYALSENRDQVVLDLCNGYVATLSNGNAELVSNANDIESVYFMRPDSQQPMVLPNLSLNQESDSDAIKRLKSFINTDTDTFFILICYLTYLMANPKARGLSYPIVVIQGEKGCGKTFFCNNVVRGIIDPSSMSGIPFSGKMDDYVLILNSMFLVVFDNLRSLTKAQSDMLCTTATKGSAPRRKLYTTGELAVLELHSPLILNGIHDFVQESDLASRCIHVKLYGMPEKQRKPEQELKDELQTLMPDLVGALLKLTARAMVELPSVRVEHSARMMDFSKWIGALEQVWGIRKGKLQKAYQKNVETLMASGTADDSVTIALQKLIKSLKEGEAWRSTPSGLLTKLQDFESSHFLPKGAAALTAKIRGQESSLNANGIYFKFGRDAERYVMVSAQRL